jgi:calcineurin-like phosphoesterase family protein
MVYIWSDLHLGDSSSLSSDSRKPFNKIEEVDNLLINNWKNTIKPEDTIINLGDFTNKKPQKYLKELVHNLPGYKILILGDYDTKYTLRFWRDIGFNEVYNDPITYEGKYILSHDAIKIDENTPYVNIHGHIHNRIFSPSRVLITENHLNVSVEYINYEPVLIDNIINLMNSITGKYELIKGKIGKNIRLEGSILNLCVKAIDEYLISFSKEESLKTNNKIIAWKSIIFTNSNEAKLLNNAKVKLIEGKKLSDAEEKIFIEKILENKRIGVRPNVA